jgi:hypothetical protein
MTHEHRQQIVHSVATHGFASNIKEHKFISSLPYAPWSIISHCHPSRIEFGAAKPSLVPHHSCHSLVAQAHWCRISRVGIHHTPFLNSQQIHTNSHLFKLSQAHINFSYEINFLLH